MRGKFSGLKRIMALGLAAALLVSGMPLRGSSAVHAAPADPYYLPKAIADTYSEFTDAERSLLRMLRVGLTVSAAEPSKEDELVTVDTAAHTITAESFTSDGNVWKAVSAELYDREENLVEQVTLTDGVGSYTYASNAFTAEVLYTLECSVPESEQVLVVEALQALATGKQAADSVYSSADALDTVASVMDILVKLRNGIGYTLPGGVVVTLQFAEKAQAAVDALNKQCKANGGRLELQLHNEIYGAGSATEYLASSGEDYRLLAAQTYGYLKDIAEDPALATSFIDNYISQTQPGLASAWKTMKTEINNAVKHLGPAAEPWDMLERSFLPVGLTSTQYYRMDSLIDELNIQQTITAPQDITWHSSLTMASVKISCSSSMVELELKARLQYYTEINEPVFLEHSRTELVEEGTSRDNVRALFDAFRAEAEKLFEEQGFDLSAYQPEETTDTPDGPLEDMEKAFCHVSFVPREVPVTLEYSGEELLLPVGWHLTLESHPDSSLVYEYEIGGAPLPNQFYLQGSIFTVDHRSIIFIDRKPIKPAIETDLLALIAKAYGTEKETAILTSGALLGNEALSIRWPDNEDGTLIVTGDGTLTFNSFRSGVGNLYWMPYSYRVGDAEYEISTPGIQEYIPSGADTVYANYRLLLDHKCSAAAVQQWLDTVDVMAGDAVRQKGAMDRLNSQYNAIGQITKGMLNILKSSIYDTELHEDWATNEELQDYLVEVVSNIINDCVDNTGKLRLYTMLGKYRDPNSGGLYYYYRNSKAIINEVELLGTYLSQMLADDLKRAAVQKLMTEFGYPQYADRFSELEALMQEVSGDLTAPNAAIDVSSKNLNKLISALLMEGTTGTENAGALILTETIAVAAPTKAALKIEVSVGNRVLGSVELSFERDENHVLTQQELDALVAEAAKLAKDNLDTKYYTDSFDTGLTGLMQLVGRVMDSNVTVKNVWTPVEYTVHIDGGESQTVTVEDLTVEFPEPPIGFRYDYLVDGTVCGAGPYTFTTEQLDRLFADGSYTVACDRVNVAAERLIEFLDRMNQAGGSTMRFTLNDAQDTVTVEVDAANKSALNACMQNVVLTMLDGYGYMALNNEPMLYTTEKDMVEVSLQAIYDAVLHDSSFTHETIIGLRDGEGLLATTSLQLGDSPEQLEQDLKFEIYMTSVSSEIVSLGNYMARAENNMTFQANEGVLDVEMTLTEDMYMQLLVGMLMTGRTKLSQVNEVPSGAAAHFMLENIKEMVSDENVTATTYDNTLAMLGRESDLSQDQAYYEYLAGVLRTAQLQEQLNGCAMVQTVDIKTGLDEAVGDDPAAASVLGMIKEYNGGGVKMDLYISLNNTADFAAVLVGDTVRLLKDLENLPERSGTLVLLTDVTAQQLVLPHGLTLDLNGCNVAGDIVAQGALTLTDSRHATGEAGLVSGKVIRENPYEKVTIYGGRYANDVSEFVADGLSRIDGEVRDGRYRVETDENGNLTYHINWDAPAGNQELPYDILLDILANTMGIGSMDFEGRKLYDLQRRALMEQGTRAVQPDGDPLWNVLVHADKEGLAALLKALWMAPYNLEAAAKGKPLGQYTFTLYPWDVHYEHIVEGDYLDVNLLPTGQARQITVTVRYDVDNETVLEEAAAWAEIFSLNGMDVTVQELSYGVIGRVMLKLQIDNVSWNLDLSGNGQYLVMLGALLAGLDPAMSFLVPAVNSGDPEQIKDALDEHTTLGAVLKALTNMPDSLDLKALAQKAGITLELSEVAALEARLHSGLVKTARLLAQWIPTLGDQTFGSVVDDEGIYRFTDRQYVKQDGMYALGDTELTVLQGMNTDATLKLTQGKRTFHVLDAQGKVIARTDDLETAMGYAANGTKLVVNKPTQTGGLFRLEKDLILEGAANLPASFWVRLTGSIRLTADGPVNVCTDEKGKRVDCAQENGLLVYAVRALVTQPQLQASGKLATAWTTEVNGGIYLNLDADPVAGISRDALREAVSFGDLDALGGKVEFTLTGNSDRIRTGDTLQIAVYSDDGVLLTTAEFTVVVSGDVNKDGRVTAGDAVAITAIYGGNRASFTQEQLMAADTNRNGTAGSPRIDAGDAVRIMTKYMDWNGYRSSVSGQ